VLAAGLADLRAELYRLEHRNAIWLSRNRGFFM
jgi:hypothetical protein